MSALETRSAFDLTVGAIGQLVGTAARFNTDSQDLGGYTESIVEGAFYRTLLKPDSILALLDHDHQKILGRVGSGTLKLTQDQRGLHYVIDLPDTSYGRDLETLVRRGDVAGASFAFTVPKGGDSWTQRNGLPHRELLDVDLHEITITASPAYADTSVAKRHLQWSQEPYSMTAELMRLELETL